MKISRIKILNFRSIKEIDFKPSDYCVVVGENNAGKTNILRALSIILGDSWPSERSFSEDDFHNNDTTQDIVIQVFFDQVRQQWTNSFPVSVAGFELRCKAYKRKVGNKPAGSLKTDFVCLSPNGDSIQVPASPLKKGEKYTGQWLPMRVNSELREGVPFIYVDVMREYDRQQPSSRWSILRRLFDAVNTEFLNSKEQVAFTLPDGTKTKVTRKEAYEKRVTEAYDYLRTQSFKEIEEKLAANTIEQMGIEAGEGNISMHFETHDPTHVYKSLQLFVEQMGITTSATEVGAGLQSAIVLGIFRTYEELKKSGAVFAIEEPEVFLHPQKARYFASILKRLTESGNQVFVTTHSPIFVPIDTPESVFIARRSAASGTKVFQSSHVNMVLSERQALRLMSEFDAQRNELFFARKIILVEGNTEKIALPLLFRKMNIDINKAGISVIECGGKTKMPLFAKVANAFSIPLVILADEDLQLTMNGDDRSKHERWNEQLRQSCPIDRLFFMKPTFEAEAGLSKEDSEKVDQALKFCQEVLPENIPAIIKQAIEKLNSI